MLGRFPSCVQPYQFVFPLWGCFCLFCLLDKVHFYLSYIKMLKKIKIKGLFCPKSRSLSSAPIRWQVRHSVVTACVTALARERQNLNKQFSAFFPTLFSRDGLILCVTLGPFDLAALRKNGQSMTSMYRESDKRDWSYAFEWLSRYFDVIHWPFCIASLKVERAYSILQNHVLFYNQDAVFEVWTIPKQIQTIPIPEERRRKQRKMCP